jgi:Pvc16 N-terminal domain
MSNSLAVPAVTAAITSVVQARIDRAGITPRPTVAPGPLDDSSGTPSVGIHLYKVTRNAALSIADLPTRGADGQLRQRPVAALDLHYLFTFRGTGVYESEQLLALTASALHTIPVLTPAIVDLAATQHPEIAGNDLALAAEPVRVTPETVSSDDITRLWAVYEPGAFTVTLAVAAGPVLIDASELAPIALPARQVNSPVIVINPPRLDVVAGPNGPGAPVSADSPMPSLSLLGATLAARQGEDLVVLLDGTAVSQVTTVDDGRLSISLAGVTPGVHGVQVQRLGPAFDPASPTREVAATDVVSFALLPTLVSATAATAAGTVAGERTGTVTAEVVPDVGPAQQVRLLLDSQALDPPVSLALTPAWPSVPPNPPYSSVQFPVTDAPAGDYQVTLEVSGVRSLPDFTGEGYSLTVVTL